MNLSTALKNLFQPCAALAVAGGALLLASCETAPPPVGAPFPPGPPRFGAGGTQSPNYPAEPRALPGPTTPTPPKIVRDPNNTTVNVTPPESKSNPPSSPPSSSTPGEITAPATDTPSKPPAAVKEDLPYGIPVVGKKGMVYSPYAPEKGQVDVEGYKRGTKVECPYTKKPFRVP